MNNSTFEQHVAQVRRNAPTLPKFSLMVDSDITMWSDAEGNPQHVETLPICATWANADDMSSLEALWGKENGTRAY